MVILSKLKILLDTFFFSTKKKGTKHNNISES